MRRGYISRLFQRDVFRRLQFEPFEPRRVMAGNVTAEVIDGDLIITGDDEANTIAIRQSDIGSYVVESDRAVRVVLAEGSTTSADSAIGPTQVNGEFRDAVFHEVTRRILIHAGRGDDHVDIRNVSYVNGLSPVPSSFAAPGHVTIDGGAGYDTIEVGERLHFTLLSSLGEPNLVDQAIAALGIAGDLQIDTGADGGNIYVRPGTIGGALNITATSNSEHANSIGVAGVTAASFSLNGSDGTELVLIVSLNTSGPVAMTMGAGNDDVQLHSLDLDGDASIDLGAGNDRVTAMGSVRGNLTVQGAAGSDSLILGGETRPERSIRMVGNPFWVPPLDGGDPVSTMELGAGGPLVVQGNLNVETGGGDYLNLQHTTVDRVLRIDSGEANTPEFIRIRHVSAGGVAILAGGGDDIVNIAFMTAHEMLNANLGAGDDLLSMAIVAYMGANPSLPGGGVRRIIPAAGLFGHEGHDAIVMNGCHFRSITHIDVGNGDNYILISRSIVDDGRLIASNGNDTIGSEFSVFQRLSINSGGGSDNVLTRVSVIDEVFYGLGAGDDSLEVTGSIVQSMATADGGAGFDTLNRLHSRIKQFNATNFEAGNDAGLLFS